MPDAWPGERACAYVVVKESARFDLTALRVFLVEARVAMF
jgi:non-ribosomal peptide synthetase component E (peptide arylation enzyme)